MYIYSSGQTHRHILYSHADLFHHPTTMVDDVERGSDSYTSTIEAGTAHKRGGAVPQKHEQSQYSKTDKLDASNIGRAAAARALRLLRRRGNLLAVLVFGT